MLIAAPLICGFLLVALMVVVLIEVHLGLLPRWFAYFPLIFFGGYYTLYFHQTWQIHNVESNLQQNNPSLIYRFNSDQEHLVTKHANRLVTSYKIPVVYEKHKTYKHLSYRMVSSVSCGSIPKDSEARIHTSNVSYRKKPLAGRKFGSLRAREGLCLLRMPEQPSVLQMPEQPRKSIISVNVKDQNIWKRKSSIEEGIYSLLKNGKKLGQYRTASVHRYNIFPLPIIGCYLISSPAKWQCVFSFNKSLYRLKTNPSNLGQKVNLNPVALMLGLEKYDEEDYKNYTEYPESFLAIAEASGMADKLINGMFEQLDNMMIDSNSKIAWRMEYTLTRNPYRIIQRADRIVQYLEKLESSKRGEIYDTNGKKRLMFSLLAWLPDYILKPHSAEIFKRLTNYKELGNAPELYMRLADFSKNIEGLSMWYEKHLITGQIKGWQNYLPISALCRVGEASDETIAFMKKEFKLGPDKSPWSKKHKALFLALRNLGEQQFAKEILKTQKIRYKKWYTSVINGETDGIHGPNNCMVRGGMFGGNYPPSKQSIIDK